MGSPKAKRRQSIDKVEARKRLQSAEQSGLTLKGREKVGGGETKKSQKSGGETKKSQKSIKSNKDLYADLHANENYMFSSAAEASQWEDQQIVNLTTKKNARLTALAYDTAAYRKKNAAS